MTISNTGMMSNMKKIILLGKCWLPEHSAITLKWIAINICTSLKETNNIYSDRSHKILIMHAKYKHMSLLLIKIMHTGVSQSTGNKEAIIISLVPDLFSNPHHYHSKDKVNILVDLIHMPIIKIKDPNPKHLPFSTNSTASNLARQQGQGRTNQPIKMLISMAELIIK